MEAIKDLFNKATKESRCVKKAGIFTGNEDFNSAIELLFSPLGVEFCTKYNFPKLEDWSALNTEMLESKNVFVNSGNIELTNPEKVFLIGNTNAIINYTNVDKQYDINIMHGATINIKASNGALVFVYGKGNIKYETTDLAKVYVRD